MDDDGWWWWWWLVEKPPPRPAYRYLPATCCTTCPPGHGSSQLPARRIIQMHHRNDGKLSLIQDQPVLPYPTLHMVECPPVGRV